MKLNLLVAATLTTIATAAVMTTRTTTITTTITLLRHNPSAIMSKSVMSSKSETTDPAIATVPSSSRTASTPSSTTSQEHISMPFAGVPNNSTLPITAYNAQDLSNGTSQTRALRDCGVVTAPWHDPANPTASQAASIAFCKCGEVWASMYTTTATDGRIYSVCDGAPNATVGTATISTHVVSPSDISTTVTSWVPASATPMSPSSAAPLGGSVTSRLTSGSAKHGVEFLHVLLVGTLMVWLA